MRAASIATWGLLYIYIIPKLQGEYTDGFFTLYLLPDSLLGGVVPPVSRGDLGSEVKGTETRGHSMTEIGTSLMTGTKLTLI